MFAGFRSNCIMKTERLFKVTDCSHVHCKSNHISETVQIEIRDGLLQPAAEVTHGLSNSGNFDDLG